MTICFVGTYSSEEPITGPTKVGRRIFEQALAHGHQAVFIEYFFDGTEHSLCTKLFGLEHRVDSSGASIHRAGIFRFLPLLIRIRPSIVHIITFERFAVLVYLARIFSPFRIVYTIHGLMRYEEMLNESHASVPERFKQWCAESLFLKHSDALFHLSPSYLRLVHDVVPGIRSMTFLVDNGIDDIFFSAPRPDDGNRDLRILWVGVPHRKEKGHDFLLKALEDIPPNIRLEIVGAGWDSADFSPISENRIKLHGMKTSREMASIMQRCDVIFLTSRLESFGMVVAEAMATGTIPIVTDVSGISRHIRNGENGFVVPFGDAIVAQRIIRRLATSPDTVADISRNVRKSVRGLSWERIWISYDKAYAKVNARHARHKGG